MLRNTNTRRSARLSLAGLALLGLSACGSSRDGFQTAEDYRYIAGMQVNQFVGALWDGTVQAAVGNARRGVLETVPEGAR